ncbi:MAG: TetR/AcrR family transcriptional regulator [Jatrophihabitans sp.]
MSEGTAKTTTGLPASLEAVWGIRDRPSRGPKPGLTVDAIVAAAVQLARTDGLGVVSMARVATRLGVSTMSLYRYVASKDELLMLMADAVCIAVPGPPAKGESWRDGLARWAWAERTMYWNDPWVLAIPITGPPVAPNQTHWMELGLRCMRDTPLPEQEKMSVLLMLSGYSRYDVILMSGIAKAAQQSAPGQQLMPRFAASIRALTDADRFPALWRALDSGAFDQDDEPDTEFRFGLHRILDGVEVLINGKGARKRKGAS